MAMAVRDTLFIQQRLEEVASMLESPPAASQVLGVVVEIDFQQGQIVIAGYANGDARLLWSKGGGLFGDLYQFPDIAAAAKALCTTAQPLVETLPLAPEQATNPAPLPTDSVRMSVLTMTHLYSGTARGPEILHPGHPLQPTFTAANNLYDRLEALQESTKKPRPSPETAGNG